MNEHTTILMVLSDGSHRSVFTQVRMPWKDVVQRFSEQARMCATSSYSRSRIVSAVVVVGTDVNQYTASEVAGFVQTHDDLTA